MAGSTYCAQKPVLVAPFSIWAQSERGSHPDAAVDQILGLAPGGADPESVDDQPIVEAVANPHPIFEPGRLLGDPGEQPIPLDSVKPDFAPGMIRYSSGAASAKVPGYWQSARALAVHCPKPLAIMLRMTEQTYVFSAAGLPGPAL